jgi:hypothetical protein
MNTNITNSTQKNPLSAFGELKTENDIVKSNYIFVYGQNGTIQSFTTAYPSLKSYSASNLSNVSFTDGCIVVSDSDSQLNTPSIIYGELIRYIAGVGCNCLFTARFQYNSIRRTLNDGYARQLIGIGSKNDTDGIQDGFLFGYDSDVSVLNGQHKFAIHHYRNGVLKERIYQENWNMDKGDGSGELHLMNWNDYTNVFRISYQYLGFGAIYFYVENKETGSFINVHIIKYANSNSETSLSDPSMGFFMLQETKTNARPENGNDLDKLYCASFSMKHEGMRNEGQLIYCVESGQKTSSANVETHLLSIRSMATFYGKSNKLPILISGLSLSTDGTKSVIIRIYINKTLTGTAYSQPYVYTPVERTTTATLGAGGILTASIQMAKIDNLTKELENLNLYIQSGDVITITSFSTANNDISCAITWKNS